MKKSLKKYFKPTFLILLCLMFVSSLIFVSAITTKVFETDAIKGVRTAHFQQSRNLIYKNGFITVDEDASRKNFTIRYLNKEGKELKKKVFTNKYTTIIETDGKYLYLDVSEPLKEDEDERNTSVTSIVKLDENLNEVGKVNLDGLSGTFYDPFYLTNARGIRNLFLDSINPITGRINFFHFNDDGSILVYTDREYYLYGIPAEERKCNDREPSDEDCEDYDYNEDKNGVKYGVKYLLIDKDFKKVDYIDPTDQQVSYFTSNENKTESDGKTLKRWYSIRTKNNYTLKAGLYYAGPSLTMMDYIENQKVSTQALLKFYKGGKEKFTIQTKDYERFYGGEIMDDYIVFFGQKGYDSKLDTYVNDILVYDFNGKLVDKLTDMTAYNQLKVEGNGFIATGMYVEGCNGEVTSTEHRPDFEYELGTCESELRHMYYRYNPPTTTVTPPDTSDLSLILLVLFGLGTGVSLIVGLKKYNFMRK